MTIAALPRLPAPRPATGAAPAEAPAIGGQWALAGTVLALLLVPVALSPVAGFVGLLLCAGAAFAAATLYAVAGVRLDDRSDLAGLLLVPLLISAFQNVYLGLVAPYADSLAIQLALLTHVVFAVLLLAGYFFARRRAPLHPLLPQVLVVGLVVLVFAVVSVGAMRAGLVPMVSSARNMLSPFIFLMLGLLLAERVRLASFLAMVAALAWATLAFGLVEYFASRELWSLLNIDELWRKKGIPNLASWGLPLNFVSSEKFFGEHVRRMVSSYADPVNFGTVLFLFFMVAWYTGRRWLQAMCVVAVALAVSKGALLGLFVFAIVWAWHRAGRVAFVAGLFVVALAGAGVVGYTLTHSTQSLATHVGGLAAALASLPAHPFGRGLGGVGVLAEGAGAVRESGLGLVIGQLGVLAFVIFGALFYGVWRWLLRLDGARERVLGQTLFLAILANIAFNEVALSPNSSAGYFMLIGLLLAGDRWRRQASVLPAAAGARRAT